MEDAVKVIKRKFKHMKGFELHKVYFVDDEFSESTLQAVNAKGKKQGWTLARSLLCRISTAWILMHISPLTDPIATIGRKQSSIIRFPKRTYIS